MAYDFNNIDSSVSMMDERQSVGLLIHHINNLLYPSLMAMDKASLLKDLVIPGEDAYSIFSIHDEHPALVYSAKLITNSFNEGLVTASLSEPCFNWPYSIALISERANIAFSYILHAIASLPQEERMLIYENVIYEGMYSIPRLMVTLYFLDIQQVPGSMSKHTINFSTLPSFIIANYHTVIRAYSRAAGYQRLSIPYSFSAILDNALTPEHADLLTQQYDACLSFIKWCVYEGKQYTEKMRLTPVFIMVLYRILIADDPEKTSLCYQYPNLFKQATFLLETINKINIEHSAYMHKFD